MRRVLLSFIIAAAAAPVAAQDTHGSLYGIVVTEAGAPIQAATVTVASASLQRVRSYSTTARGSFRFLGLPVGEYTVRVIAIGQRPVTLDAVRVGLGAVTSVEQVVLESMVFELAPILVTGGPSPIDFTSTTFGARLDQSDFELLPSDRSFRDLLRVAPHTFESSRGDGLNVAGSTGIENMFFVDGINTTDPYLAASSTALPHNFVDEVQLLSGGYEAEFGRSLGGIINVVTKSGGNEFHGSLFGYFNNHSITAQDRLVSGGRTSRGADVYDLGFTVGGPLVRDRLWFFAAYDPTFENREVQIDRFGFFGHSSTDHLFAGKLTWSPQVDTRVVLSVLGDLSTADRIQPGPFTHPDSLISPGPLLNRFENGGVSSSLVLTRDFGGEWLVEASLGYQQRRIFDGPRPGDDSARVAVIHPLGNGDAIEAYTGGYGEWIDSDNERLSAKFAVTRSLDRHTIKAGVEWETTRADERNGNTAPGVVIADLGVPDNPDACRIAPFFNSCRHFAIYLEPTESKVSARFPGAFVQNSWRATDRLTVNAGLRLDAQYWVGTDGKVAQRVTGEWQPRVGFTLNLTGSGAHKLSGSAGRFYQQTALRLVTTRANDADENGIVFYDGLPSEGGERLDGSGFVSCCAIEAERSGLHGSHFDELSLGYDGLTNNRYRFGVRGIVRTLRDALQPGECDQDPASVNACGPGGESGLGNPGRGILSYLDPVERIYRALELSFAIENDPRYSFAMNYVFSRNAGNYPGAHDTDQGGFFLPNNNRSYRLPAQMNNNNGLLPNDHTHALKVRGSYRVSSRLGIGAFLNLRSGVPISRLIILNQIAFIPGFLTPRGSEGRTPSIWDLDLRLAYTAGGAGLRPRFTLDLMNLGNSRRALAVDNQFERISGRGNPFWGEPLAFQAPRAARMGVELLF